MCNAAPTTRPRAFWWVALALVLLQGISRYGPAPVVDFNLDDWTLLAHAQSDDPRTFLQLGLQDADRPIGTALLVLFYRSFGDHPLPYAIFSMAGFSIVLLVFLLLVREVTGDPIRAPLAAGAVLTLWPTLTESFAWPVASAYALAFAGYAGAALFWHRFLRTGRPVELLGMTACYFCGLFQYEVGLGLPLAFLILGWRAPRRRLIAGLLVLGTLTLAYLTWRFTRGFGTAPGVYFPSRRPGLSLAGLLWNARETAFWWMGPHLWSCLTNGWTAFGRMATRGWLLWAGISALAAAGLTIALRRSPATDRPPARVVLFFLAWFLGSVVVSLPAWNCGRLNLLPAMGLAGLLAMQVAHIPAERWASAVLPLAFLALLANQGTALDWRDAGRLQRDLLHALRMTEPAWRDQELIWFDSTQLRQRQTAGLQPVPSLDEKAWAYAGNAGLLRGFGLSGLVDLVATQTNRPTVLLDTEGRVEVVGSAVVWHPRFRPENLRTSALERVYRMDALTGRPLPWPAPH